ncbi:MAG: Uma2 family endonuclease [Microcoleus sp. PH2017_13_LAR_U_A]|uniref:Uma2 family endonuclease n=1 Tax=Microcoleus sp. PH2017_13_LAR_U_A TaxID=2798824 RepID=UPI001DF9C56E|nr:Uma2 family endonuclease [Microcoleus sp. PH2017_13_LAR_U_A]MCC3472091.1 Uma2 family endonuclease [Microcoleus sp. PH2017_13_LAR_U_A]
MVQTFTEPQTISLEVPNSIALTVTGEQFDILALANPDLRLERTAEGELIVNPPTGGESGNRNLSISGQVDRWCETHEDLGEGFDSSTGFILPNGATRSPDASWVSRARWEALTPKERKGFVPLCPDFVVELREAKLSRRESASDSLSTLQAKMREYMDNGARLGWLIDPQNQRVEIYRQQAEVEGFVLNLRRVWR